MVVICRGESTWLSDFCSEILNSLRAEEAEESKQLAGLDLRAGLADNWSGWVGVIKEISELEREWLKKWGSDLAAETNC